eukprot:TRINITY_DN352_c0_g1_i2.p1 TRINITY_DN352_c0_g1~~TRINITY_DN352_c0_g1_i2.p1  ORF type:complete len:201 (-),score=60.57 TRINITY_DN352_c0_g1_i2:42-602(-)
MASLGDTLTPRRRLKIVFLDVDGVLVPTNAQWFSVTAMMLLKLLVQTTGAQIVLSSRWRITQLTRSIVEKRLAVDGLSLHSCTPNSVDGGADNRALEIVEWLENAEKRGDVVAEWVVLDDAPVEKLDPRMKNHCVKVADVTGLRWKDIEAAFQILNVRVPPVARSPLEGIPLPKWHIQHRNIPTIY